VRFMQALWAEPHTTFRGELQHVDEGGLTLRPKSGRVPVWCGGHVFHRVAKYGGDEYMQLDDAPGGEALAALAKPRALSVTLAANWRTSDWRSGSLLARATRMTGGRKSHSGRTPALRM
jgi:alkanesulfonate monooxygenase SsuD/methylene tetrahydromethanopterin reductase-like flavin-dependent oxidoreductase (luciferase family)